MKVVVDSNIIFSAILNSSSKIGQILTLGGKFFDFYSVDLLKIEIARHRDKLVKLSKLSVDQVETNIDLLCSRIKFVDTIILSNEQIESALK